MHYFVACLLLPKQKPASSKSGSHPTLNNGTCSASIAGSPLPLNYLWVHSTWKSLLNWIYSFIYFHYKPLYLIHPSHQSWEKHLVCAWRVLGLEPEFSSPQYLSFELRKLTLARRDNTSCVLSVGWPSSGSSLLSLTPQDRSFHVSVERNWVSKGCSERSKENFNQ